MPSSIKSSLVMTPIVRRPVNMYKIVFIANRCRFSIIPKYWDTFIPKHNCLDLEAPITTTAEDFFFFVFFQVNKMTFHVNHLLGM